ncbi:MAG: TIGR02757 family protein [Pseudomonadota bacterium]
MQRQNNRMMLENLYRQINRREYVSPDPLQFLYAYRNVRDREIVGLIASCLAYGRVAQILKSVEGILEVMGPSPYRFLERETHQSLVRTFSGFKHRFADGKHLAALLSGIKNTIARFGSLNACFHKGYAENQDNTIAGMGFLADNLMQGGHDPGHLVPLPDRGSACKRMNLFLRWMVRKDDVDPGGWKGIPASGLIVPLDTHMHRMGIMLGYTDRKQANMITAMEITDGFRKIMPRDPVRYDFALTRLGIRNDLKMEDFLKPNLTSDSVAI